jgi:hypothetical protein
MPYPQHTRKQALARLFRTRTLCRIISLGLLPGCIEPLKNIIPEAKTITERDKTLQNRDGAPLTETYKKMAEDNSDKASLAKAPADDCL